MLKGTDEIKIHIFTLNIFVWTDSLGLRQRFFRHSGSGLIGLN